MKSFNQKYFVAAYYRKTSFFILNRAFATTLLVSCLVSPMQAAITWSGSIDPSDPTTWSRITSGYIGKLNSPGTITVDSANSLQSYYGYIGGSSSSESTVTVTGPDSKWINTTVIYVGYDGLGTLNIEDGGQVSNKGSYLGSNNSSSIGTVTVTGAGSKWTNSGSLYVGDEGAGILNIEAGGQVSNTFGCLGYNSSSSGTARVIGTDSKWINSGDLYIGFSGTGTLNIEAGGQVSNPAGYLGFNTGSAGIVTVTGAGSTWTNSGELAINAGTLNIEAGGQVSNTVGRLRGIYGASGTVTVTGTGSKWTNSNSLFVGTQSNATLNIGSGIASDGVVSARYIYLADNVHATAICNLNGGTLQATSITKGISTATFNWSDGTIRNFDPSTDLTVSGNLGNINLAATGTHTFNIDAGRTGTVSAVLCDATSGGTLAKQGDGLLVLSAVNTYTGTTTIESGRLKLVEWSDIAFSSEIINRAGFIIDGGNHSVKKITGSGTTQVLSGSLTVGSIVQDTLTIGGIANAVPEPASLVLLAIFGFAVAGMAWRRRER